MFDLGAIHYALNTADTLRTMAPDPANKQPLLDWLGAAIPGRYEIRSALRALANRLQPQTYLEIGVRRGWSLAQVICECPTVDAWACDMWVPGYGGCDNPGPHFVRSEIAKACPQFRGRLTFVNGDSHEWLPKVFPNGQRFDLITVDGDHTGLGAWQDLAWCLPRLSPGGALVFDDLVPGSDDGGRFTLLDAWEKARQTFTGYEWIENRDSLVPLGIAVRTA